MHCSLCVLYQTQLKGTLKNLPYYYYKLIIFISLSLSWLVPILLWSMREPAYYREGSAPITSIIPLCCVVPDTVNDNQWTNNNLAGLIMRTMLTQQLVIHWSICQYRESCYQVEREITLFITIWLHSEPQTYTERRKFHSFSIDSKSMMLYFERANFFRLKLVSNWHIYPPSFQIKKIRYRVYPFPQIMHIKKVTSCLPIIK